MEYLLLTAFVIGVLLFAASWLRVIFAGFGHHFVTGIVSAFPVINLLILPGIWHKVYGWVFTGIIGLLVAVGSWYAGAEEHVYRYAHETGISLPGPVAEGALDDNTRERMPSAQDTIADDDTPAAPLAPGQVLPKKALYKMTYQKVASTSLGEYIGSYVRITRTDRKTFEGKVLGLADNGILVERRASGGVIEQRIGFDDITHAEVMRKQ
ncbi:MAG: Unknown protein [uncultured Thiotrichaceae bacterium]|uniref:Uncharacterized protein n=1 Tax=uncultured Thiotrichaceae bacterium TaxID=298394 RepID=A0A6S6U2D3_9GAMM|nr:MAG: Unknown protein [uncultured Thiotrichaceae bacterium]